MKMKNNLFSFATSELSQDAFICWCLNWINYPNEELYSMAKDIFLNLLKEANKLIIGAPMINFNIPVTLKNFIDHIAIANKTFSYKYSKKGDAIGLLNNLDVQIIATQGAPLDWYPFASHYKFLEGFWNFVGANVKESIIIHSVKIAENIKKTKEEFYEENKALIELKAKEL